MFGTDVIVRRFTESFGWLHSAIKVREITGYNIEQTFELNVIEFLNYMSYIKSYNVMDEALKREEANKGTKKKYY